MLIPRELSGPFFSATHSILNSGCCIITPPVPNPPPSVDGEEPGGADCGRANLGERERGREKEREIGRDGGRERERERERERY